MTKQTNNKPTRCHRKMVREPGQTSLAERASALGHRCRKSALSDSFVMVG